MTTTSRAPRNRTLSLSEAERTALKAKLISERQISGLSAILNKTIHGDALGAARLMPQSFVDLLILLSSL